MRLVRVGPRGRELPGVLDDEGLARDVSFVAHALITEEGVEELSGLDLRNCAVLDGRVGAPISRPGTVLCVGLNYRDHVIETGAEFPREPVLFQKATNTIVGPYDPIVLPPRSRRTDWEIELGIVIGRRALYLSSEQEGWDAILGYVLSHDVSERDFQLDRGGQWTKGKSAPSFNPLGPWLCTADEIRDPLNLEMSTTVNGVVMQKGSTKDMIFNPGYLVWYATQFMQLEPGDLINTGTPAGVAVGRKNARYLMPGDQVELQIEMLGRQKQICESVPSS